MTTSTSIFSGNLIWVVIIGLFVIAGISVLLRRNKQKPTDEMEAEYDETEQTADGTFDGMSSADVVANKLDLARAYSEMGEHNKVRDLLNDVIRDGNEEQQQEARTILDALTIK